MKRNGLRMPERREVTTRPFYDAFMLDLVSRAVVWHDLSEGSGNTLHDRSENGHDATLVGPNWGPGKLGPEIVMDGNNDYASSSIFTVPDLTKQTIVFVVKNSLYSHGGYAQVFMSLGFSLLSGSESVYRLDNSNHLGIQYSNGTIAWEQVPCWNMFNGFDDTDLFVTITIDYEAPYDIKFYRNLEGIISSSNLSTPVNIIGDRQILIGDNGVGSGFNLKGGMSFLALIPEILTAPEISLLYHHLMGV